MKAAVPGTFCVPEDNPAEAHLLGSRCRECGTTVFPQISVCPGCRRNHTLEAVAMGKTARLFSHAIAYVAVAGFRAPYYQAFVDLPEGPRVFSLLSSKVPVQPGLLEDGMELKLTIEPVADTPEKRHLLTYKYCPAGYCA